MGALKADTGVLCTQGSSSSSINGVYRSLTSSSPYAPRIISIADNSWVSSCEQSLGHEITWLGFIKAHNPIPRSIKKSCLSTARSEIHDIIHWTEVSPSTITKIISRRSAGPSRHPISKPSFISSPVPIACVSILCPRSCLLEVLSP